MNRRTFIFGGAATIVAAGFGSYQFVHGQKFGRPSFGSFAPERWERMLASPHFQNGQFQNLVPVEIMANRNDSKLGGMIKFLFRDKSHLAPRDTMLTQKIDLGSLPLDKDIAMWLGHSSFYLQLAGHRILIDPVFSSYASPLFFINKAFKGSNAYAPADFPPIDVLVLTHDHWDHLDYPTVMAIKPNIKEVVCPLGVGEYFEQWGFEPAKVHEGDWYDEVTIDDKLSITILPSQHFSGRFLKANPTLWAGFAFVTPQRRVYCSGDGGYGDHFKIIGERFGGFDLALMENGQYNMQWHHIHNLPEETAQAAVDVKARRMIPAHSGKFALAYHDWDEPYRDLVRYSRDKNYQLLTPMNGEPVYLDDDKTFDYWWNNMS